MVGKGFGFRVVTGVGKQVMKVMRPALAAHSKITGCCRLKPVLIAIITPSSMRLRSL